MECNKAEAIRSRDIAEQKFLSHDLMGAKKFALKAQHLFPGLEGLPQLLAVLDVHIIAQDKGDGADANWYGILQTHATADDATIRKQYRKLALILHPDKNKAVGADGAFKLISEAWRILSDKGKKAAHDARRGHAVRQADGFCNFTNFSTRSWLRPKPLKKTPTFCVVTCPSCQNQFQCLRAHDNDMVLCTVCHQAFAATEACKTSGDSFCHTTENSKLRGKSSEAPIPQGKPDGPRMGGSASTHSPNKADASRVDGSTLTENSKLRGKSSATPIPQGKPDGPHMGVSASIPSPNKADDSHGDGSASMCCCSDDHHMGVPASSHCGSDELHGNKKWNARPDEELNVRVTGNASQQNSDQLADDTSTFWQYQEGRPNMYGSCPPKSTTTHWHSTLQFHWGSHRNRTASNRSPTAVKATEEMVQNVYETVRRERVTAQKKARDEAMKERIEAEKEARRQELSERRERKQRRKEEESKKQAKVALHAKIAFDKLFARQHNASVEDTNIRSKARFECKTDAHEAGIVNTNSQGDHFNMVAVSLKDKEL